MLDYAAVEASLDSSEALLALCDEPQVFGARKQAQAAYALWSGADQRYVGAYRGVRIPGGSGTGFVLRLFWDTATVVPDLDEIAKVANTSLPVGMIRADEKATYKGRDKRQGVFFTWQGMRSRPLSQWFFERYRVHACVTQLFDPSDLGQDVAVVAVAGGVDHLWTLTAPAAFHRFDGAAS